MKSEFKRVVTQASEEMLARWILKNLDWSGGNSDENGAFLTSILLEHRRQCAAPEAATLNAILDMWETHKADVETNDANQPEAYDMMCDLLDKALDARRRPQSHEGRKTMTKRVLLDTDPYCPSCGHNRDTSSTSTIDQSGLWRDGKTLPQGSKQCQRCGAEWVEESSDAAKDEA
jgi:transcription elongation factor Elf1